LELLSKLLNGLGFYGSFSMSSYKGLREKLPLELHGKLLLELLGELVLELLSVELLQELPHPRISEGVPEVGIFSSSFQSQLR